MRVILRENIENLGKKGDIVNVARGYGRNYLIPQKIAIEVTSRNMKMIAIEQKALQKGFEKERASYQDLIGRLNAVTLSFTRKTSEKDVIFGSVSSTDIRDALAVKGIEVEKKKILLDEPIKRLGNYTIPIRIFHEERAEVRIEVVKEGEAGFKEEQEPSPDRVEEGAATPESVEERKEISVAEEKQDEGVASIEEETLDVPVKAEEELTPEAEVAEGIPEEAAVIAEESEEGLEDVTENSEEVKESPEDAEVVSKEPEETTEKEHRQKAASKAKK
jgi:large subunit ribosomal protein L9